MTETKLKPIPRPERPQAGRADGRRMGGRRAARPVGGAHGA